MYIMWGFEVDVLVVCVGDCVFGGFECCIGLQCFGFVQYVEYIQVESQFVICECWMIGYVQVEFFGLWVMVCIVRS